MSMESLTLNPVSSVESIIVSEAAAILENGKFSFDAQNSKLSDNDTSVSNLVVTVLWSVVRIVMGQVHLVPDVMVPVVSFCGQQ